MDDSASNTKQNMDVHDNKEKCVTYSGQCPWPIGTENFQICRVYRRTWSEFMNPEDSTSNYSQECPNARPEGRKKTFRSTQLEKQKLRCNCRQYGKHSHWSSNHMNDGMNKYSFTYNDAPCRAGAPKHKLENERTRNKVNINYASVCNGKERTDYVLFYYRKNVTQTTKFDALQLRGPHIMMGTTPYPAAGLT